MIFEQMSNTEHFYMILTRTGCNQIPWSTSANECKKYLTKKKKKRWKAFGKSSNSVLNYLGETLQYQQENIFAYSENSLMKWKYLSNILNILLFEVEVSA